MKLQGDKILDAIITAEDAHQRAVNFGDKIPINRMFQIRNYISDSEIYNIASLSAMRKNFDTKITDEMYKEAIKEAIEVRLPDMAEALLKMMLENGLIRLTIDNDDRLYINLSVEANDYYEHGSPVFTDNTNIF